VSSIIAIFNDCEAGIGLDTEMEEKQEEVVDEKDPELSSIMVARLKLDTVVKRVPSLNKWLGEIGKD
jgi:hypothetical protein